MNSIIYGGQDILNGYNCIRPYKNHKLLGKPNNYEKSKSNKIKNNL